MTTDEISRALEPGTHKSLRSAIQRALTPERPALHLGAGVILAGLAIPPAFGAPFPAEFELSSLAAGDGSTGFVLNGIDMEEFSGISVSGAGDLNGDGLDDVIIGATYGDPGGDPIAGEAYVIFGRDVATEGSFPAEFELSSLAAGDGSTGFVLNGIDPYDLSGIWVSAAGDVNGDGVDDVVVGARLADPGSTYNAGESYVVFGRDETAAAFPAEFELSSLAAGDGSTGFVLNGIDDFDRSGNSVDAAGDVNGDGIDDLIVAAEYADPGGRTNAGETYVVFGRGPANAFPSEFELSSLATGDGSTGFVLNGIDSDDDSATSVSGAGDVNGDGVDDLIIGADDADPRGVNNVGESYVVFGRGPGVSFPAEFELADLLPANGGDGSEGFVLNGIDSGDDFGHVVSAAGDFNDDGVDDLIIGAENASPGGRTDAGESYVLYGRAGDAGFAPEIEISSLLPANGGDGSTGFVLNGIDSDDDTGDSVSAAGDVDGDGVADLMIGASQGSPGGRSEAGEAYVLFGRAACHGLPAEFELSTLLTMNGGDGSAGFVLNGIDPDDDAGHSTSAAGDVNGDGVDDVVIGARLADPAGLSKAGESYVVFGRQVDGDGDGVLGDADNCPVTANADQLDGDGDGVGDACDNCVAVANPTQCDTNRDGFGNLCDADLNNDGGVTQADLGLFRSQFNSIGHDLDADLNCDGGVTQADLGLFRSLFNKTPGPSACGPESEVVVTMQRHP